MARVIDGDKLVENLRLIATCWSVSPYVSKEKHNGAIDMLREVEREVKEAPLLTPPNEPLTLKQLRKMDGEPVWVELYQAWALVEVKQNGSIMFYGNSFSCSYSRTWPVYRFRPGRHPPEGEA